MAVNASAILTKTSVTTTVKTHTRVTMARPGRVLFVIEAFGSDPTEKKVIAEVYRGSTSGTPGSAATVRKLDTTDSEATTALCAIVDVFSSESGYSAGELIQRPTFHPQHKTQTLWFKANTAETIDLRLVQDTSGTGVDCQVTVYVQG